jgi:RimJ/RimL family protein N-acetyltransferase
MMASDLAPRPTLVAANIALTAPGERDADDRQSLGRHADIERIYGASAPTTAEMSHADAQAWVRMVASTPLAWVIEHDGRCIGSARLHSLNDQDRRAAIAVGIEDPALLGRGLGTEDVRLLLTHAFDELTLHRLSARVVTSTPERFAVTKSAASAWRAASGKARSSTACSMTT